MNQFHYVLTLSFVVIILSSTASFSRADYMSPNKQMDSGVLPEDVVCQEDKILVMRNNGSTVCLYEQTALIIGWEIIPNQKSEKIPYSNGYWIPIPEEDQEDFAKKLVAAAGDSLNGTVTENRYFTDVGVILFGENSVKYNFWELFIEPSERKKFTENFMDSMGFEYDDKDFKIHDNRSYTWYYYSHEYSYVTFTFTKFMDNFSIMFGGWTNHPELVIFHLSEEVAIQKAFEYVENIEELYIPESEGGGCEVAISESANVLKYVKSGIPYYKIKVGICTHSMTYIITADNGVYVHLDAETGEVISATYPNYSRGLSGE